MYKYKKLYLSFATLVFFAGILNLLKLLTSFDVFKISTGLLLIFCALIIFILDFRGKPLTRKDLKIGVKFRLEKISGPGNEKYYFIYEGNEKLFYTDIAEFENGFYVRDGDELLKEEDYTPRLPV